LAKAIEVKGNAVNQGDLVEIVAKKTGRSQNEVREVVSELFETIGERIVAGDRVVIRNVASFHTIDKGPRKGRNPRTGEEIDVPAKKVVKAHVSDSLQNKVNPEK
jgi:nucleoid DNA-binding protein